MTIKIEATRHELEKIENLARNVDTVLGGWGFPSWRDVLCEVQEMLATVELCEVKTRETKPLIKDEKIRQVVKAWADLYGYKFVTHRFYTTTTDHRWSLLARESQEISLPEIDELDEAKDYTIEELCGEEE